MLTEILAAFIVVTAGWIGMKNYNQRQHARRREQMLIQGLNQVSADWVAFKSRLESTRLSEMESMLLHVKATGEVLAVALAAQAQSGKTGGTTNNANSLLREWKMNQSNAERAQKSYDGALEQYREFVQSLPPGLRSRAAERGNSVIALVFN